MFSYYLLYHNLSAILYANGSLIVNYLVDCIRLGDKCIYL